jgi:hypothetical protein
MGRRFTRIVRLLALAALLLCCYALSLAGGEHYSAIDWLLGSCLVLLGLIVVIEMRRRA